MQTSISKEFRWEMAHRLPWHEGGCKNLHGHGYRMTVELRGEPMSNGMLLDYFDLTTIVAPFIEEVDHAFLCDSADILMRDFLLATGLKVVFVDFSTTAENIARWFYERLSDMFLSMKHLEELTIKVAETERTSAEVCGRLRAAMPDATQFEQRGHLFS